jgi:hypothetical protein
LFDLKNLGKNPGSEAVQQRHTLQSSLANLKTQNQIISSKNHCPNFLGIIICCKWADAVASYGVLGNLQLI